ncbi:HlyD family efflux transporter periplasmic adaptor subunit, partial [Sutterella wadsworthensis]
GMVGETYVRPHEYVGEGQKLLTIYEVSAFEVEAILPAAALKVLRIGSRLTLTLDDTGAVYPVTVSRIAGSVDPVSQSVKVTGELQLPKREKAAGDAGAAALPLLPGMSGRVAWSPAP